MASTVSPPTGLCCARLLDEGKEDGWLCATALDASRETAIRDAPQKTGRDERSESRRVKDVMVNVGVTAINCPALSSIVTAQAAVDRWNED